MVIIDVRPLGRPLGWKICKLKSRTMAKSLRTAAPAPRTARKEVAARSAGRTRDPRVDEAILDTALEALMAHGFPGMSIAGVAARSGIGNPGKIGRAHV